MDRKFKGVLIVLLGGILIMLVAIYLKIPTASPTIGDLMTKNKPEYKKALLRKVPLVNVQGCVDVQGTIDVGNTPLEVEISR